MKSRSRLGTVTTISVLIPMATITILATIAVIAVSFLNAERQLHEIVQFVVRVKIDDIQGDIQTQDLEDLESKLNSIRRIKGVSDARIIYDSGPPNDISSMGDSDIDPLTFPLTGVTSAGQSHNATLVVELSRDEIWAAASGRGALVLLASGAAILGASLFIHRALNKRIVEPILTISQALADGARNWREFHIALPRPQSHDTPDEIDKLVDSIHDMRDQIRQAQDDSVLSRERLGRAAQLVGLGYCRFEVDSGKILACDETYAAMKRRTVAEMMSLNYRRDVVNSVIADEDRRRAVDVLELLARGKNVERTLRVQSGQDGVRYIRQLFRPETATDGGPVIAEAVALDITDLKVAEEKLFRSQKQEAIGKLTGGVAHDVNNMLAVISGNIELLRMEASDPALDHYLDTALAAVERGAKLTRSLLAFSRKQPLAPVVTNVAQLIKEMTPLLRTSVGETVDLEMVSDGGLWNARVDPTQLEAVIVNLVVNARDAMPGGGQLTVEACNSRLDRDYSIQHIDVDPGQYVCLSVTDSGTGMSPEMVDRAVEPFYTTKPIGKGTGLGLAMAFGFAKQSGGHLKIYSELGVGTTVKIYLPRVIAPSDVKPAVSRAVAENLLSGLDVFLIEDDDVLRETFAAQIRSLGCRVHGAADGPSALKLAEEVAHVDIILSDIILPGGMDGRVLSERLKPLYPNCKVVFMSGFTENSVIHNGRLDEGVTMLQKPFSLKDLILALTKVMQDAT